jgi:EpsI family protein
MSGGVSRSVGQRRWLVLLVLAAIVLAGSPPAALEKLNPHRELGVRDRLPTALGRWQDVTPPEHQPGAGNNYNEIFQGLYEHPALGRVALTIEYTSDSRRQFELHYPDICHEIRGDRVVPYPPSSLLLAEGGSVEAALMSWHRPGGGRGALTAYWYVTRKGVTIDTIDLKWAQALSGLLRRPSEAVMVRLDSFYDPLEESGHRESRLRAIRDLTIHLSGAVDPELHSSFFEKLKEETT